METEVIELPQIDKLPDISEIKMETGPEILNDRLPNISIITPLNNAEKTILILAESFLNLDYPKDKMEWILVDDGDEPINNLIPKMDNIHYYHFNSEMKKVVHKQFLKNIRSKNKKNNKKKISMSSKMKGKLRNRKFKSETIKIKNNFKKEFPYLPDGLKRNIAINFAKNDIIVHVNQDDYLPPKSIKLRVNELTKNKKVQVIGSNIQSMYYPKNYLSMVNGLQASIPVHKRVYTNSLSYYKSFWNKQKFDNQEDSISNFLNKRTKSFKFVNGTDLSVKLLTSESAIQHAKLIQQNEPNGWHFLKITDDLFKKISKIN